MKALSRAGLEDDTLVFFSSDNGPWISYGNHAGKTPFREAKGTGFDGGTRSACIVRYPGQVQAGAVSKQAWCSVDLLPTLAHLAGAAPPPNPIDGMNLWDLISGKPGARNPHEFYPFCTGTTFEGVLSADGRWKLHLPHDYRTLLTPGKDGKPGKYGTMRIALSLFDLEQDPQETANVLGKYPDVAARLLGYASQHRREFYPAQPEPDVI
jgi:arylsulfatase A-like enzyme